MSLFLVIFFCFLRWCNDLLFIDIVCIWFIFWDEIFCLMFVLGLVVKVISGWFLGIVCSLLISDFKESFLFLVDWIVIYDFEVICLVINSSFCVVLLFWIFLFFLK